MARGVTRRDPPKGIKDSVIPQAASLSGTAINRDTVAPEYLGSGTRDGTKFLRDDGVWVTIPGASGGVGQRSDVVKTTASLANNAEESGTVDLGKSFIVLVVTVDRACRVRLYQTAAQRTADASRAPGTLPTGEHGVILDVRLDSGTGLEWKMQQPDIGACIESSVTASIPYLIKNESGSTSTVQVTFTRLLMET